VTVRGELRRIVQHLTDHGYTVVQARSGHHNVYDHTGRFRIAFPVSPSDHRFTLNLMRSFRRAGLPPLPKKNHQPKDKR
jgi:predicted RNA binding protein YcfA (HicA-like mRNA interferase family)